MLSESKNLPALLVLNWYSNRSHPTVTSPIYQHYFTVKSLFLLDLSPISIIFSYFTINKKNIEMN